MWISARSNEPVLPKIIAIPKSKNPVANAPVKKYFIEASIERRSVLLAPAITYKGIERISIPKNNVTRFLNPNNVIPPHNDKSINAYNSDW